MATLKGGGSATAGPQRFESTVGMRRSGSGFGLSGGDLSHAPLLFDRCILTHNTSPASRAPPSPPLLSCTAKKVTARTEGVLIFKKHTSA